MQSLKASDEEIENFYIENKQLYDDAKLSKTKRFGKGNFNLLFKKLIILAREKFNYSKSTNDLDIWNRIKR